LSFTGTFLCYFSYDVLDHTFCLGSWHFEKEISVLKIQIHLL
jgi:hypothetical protein